MIDVVFLLLVFFVWTASFQIIERILPTEMQAQTGTDPVEEATPEPEEDFDNVVVRITWDGIAPGWSVNDLVAESLDEVQSRLAAVAEIKTDAPVVVHPDPEVPLGHVIEVYDVSKRTGFQTVSFAVNP